MSNNNTSAASTASSGTSAQAILIRLWQQYQQVTPWRMKTIDAYLVFCMLTGILTFVYCVLVGTFPYNAFLAAFSSCVGSFVFAANLRIQSNPENKSLFPTTTPQRAFADFCFCHVILHFFVVNFIG